MRNYSDLPRSSATMSTICGCGVDDDGFGVSGVGELDTITNKEGITSSTRLMAMANFILSATIKGNVAQLII